MRIATTVILTAVLMVGCAHNLSLVPRVGGAKGEGVAKESGNVVTISLNGKTYTGKYVYGGGSAGVTTTGGTVGGTTPFFGSGLTILGGSGAGRILASSDDGDSLRCEFQYSEWSGTGLGQCQDNAGRSYDLLINQ